MFCVPGSYVQLDLYKAAAERGYKQWTRIYYDWESLQEKPIPPLTDEDKTGQIAVGGVKLFMDGSMSNRTGWLREPYPGTTDEFGMQTNTDELMGSALAFAKENAIMIAFHAMGDRAVEHVLDFYGDEEPWLTDRPSVRIEHGSVMYQDLVDKLNSKRMNFGVCTNVDFFFCEYDSYSENLSEDQFANTYPAKRMYDQIDSFALTSDCPATTWTDPDNVFMQVQAAVTRMAYNGKPIVPEQALTVPQALMSYTGRARRVGDFGDNGTIEVGRYANWVTLTEDVFAVPQDRIIDVRAAGTWIQGEQVFDHKVDRY